MLLVSRNPAAILRVLCNFVGDAGGGGEGEGESCIPATSALQDARRQTTIIQERETESDSSSAKYSVLPVCFVPSLSPPPFCPQPLPSLHTDTLSIPHVLMRFWILVAWI